MDKDKEWERLLAEAEIRKSVLYLFHLAKRAQAADIKEFPN